VAHRKRRKAGSLDMGPPDIPSPWKLTKRDVARCELIAAVNLFFNDGDPVVVHLLAAACEDICVPIARSAGQQAFRDQVEQMVRPEYLESWRVRMKAPYNFFKHGGTDPDEELDFFDPISNDMKLLGASYDHLRAFGDIPMQATIFMGWHLAQYPQLLTDYGVGLFGRILSEFEGLDESGRKNLARDMLPAAAIVERQRSEAKQS
jgi:hypothetical protein